MEDIIVKLKSDFEVVKNLIKQKIPYSSVVLNENKWNKISTAYANKTEEVLRQQQLQSHCIIDYIIGTAHQDVAFSISCESMIKAVNNEISKALIFIKSNLTHEGALIILLLICFPQWI